MKFTEFGFDERLQEGIDSMGYRDATPVQEQVIPAIISGRDIIASAQTGTGKTAAFLLPLIHKLLTIPHDEHEVNALIVVPTRELAIQIAQAMEGMSYFTDISAIAVYGGGDGALFSTEKKALTQGADMIICTPGRMIAHLNMNYVKLDGLKYLVLDEADRMMDMGFHDDIMKIISYLPKERQNLLFSATMPPRIRELSRRILHDPLEVNIAISRPAEKIDQQAFVVYERQKMPLVTWLLRQRNFTSVLIFCSRKSNVKELARDLRRAKFSLAEVHSDLEQDQREQALVDFRNRKLQVLVATDVLSRGIDIEDIDLVINYDVPNSGEDYVHRIGRTARAASTGTAYTFISEAEQGKFAAIERLLGQAVRKSPLPEQLGEGPAYDPKANRDAGRGRNRGGGSRHGGPPSGSGGARGKSQRPHPRPPHTGTRNH